MTSVRVTQQRAVVVAAQNAALRVTQQRAVVVAAQDSALRVTQQRVVIVVDSPVFATAHPFAWGQIIG